MKSSWKKLALLAAGGMIFSALSTGIMYHFFPQYLCYAVYAVGKGNFYQLGTKEMAPGTSLTECFSPQFGFLTGINIGVKREENENTLIGRLLNEEGRVMAESQFTLKDADYSFLFYKWVDPERQYQLEILFPESNQGAVTVTLGTGDSGADEQTGLYVDGNPSNKELYAEFIYGTYSRKLLAFWFIVLFTGGFMIGETILYKLTLRRDSGVQSGADI